MTANGESSTVETKLAEGLAREVARTLERVSPLSLLTAEGKARDAALAARRHADAARVDAERAEAVEQVATALVLLKLGTNMVALSQSGTLPEALADPTGHQAAALAVLRDAGRPLDADEIRRLIGERLGRTPTRAAVQNMLSRMARRDPPLVERVRRGIYGPVGRSVPTP